MAGEAEPTRTGQALVPAQGEAVLTPAGTADVYCSIENTPANRAKIVRLLQAGSTPLSDMTNKRVSIQHVLAHRVEAISEDGEPLELIRCVLVDADGKSYSASGLGVYKSMRNLFGFYGQPPYTPPLVVEVVPVKTRRGFTTFALQPVE